MSKLTPKQESFVREYLVDLNGTAAAKRAGYKGTDTVLGKQAHELLKNPLVAIQVQEAMDERAKRTEITQDYVLTKIKETIERCSQAEQVMEFDHNTKEMVPTGEWKFEHNGVLKGCELLGRHLKLFTDKIEHTGQDGGPIVILTMPANGSERPKDPEEG